MLEVELKSCRKPLPMCSSKLALYNWATSAEKDIGRSDDVALAKTEVVFCCPFVWHRGEGRGQHSRQVNLFICQLREEGGNTFNISNKYILHFWQILLDFAILCMTLSSRGGRYIEKKLSKADISAFFKLSTKLSISEFWIWKLSTNYRYRKIHQIWSDKYMKRQSIRNLSSVNSYQKNARKITPSCLVTMKSSTD